MRLFVQSTLMLGGLLVLTWAPVHSQTTPSQPAVRDRTRKPTRSIPPTSWDAETERLFATDPLELVRGERPSVGEGEGPGPLGKPTRPQGDGGGRFAWSAVISADTVTDEIKAQLPLVAEQVRSLRAFRGGGNRKVRRQYATIAVMFGIAAEHDGSIRWQKMAPAARDAFARAAANAKTTDSNAFQESKSRFDDLSELVRGGSVEFKPPKTEFLWSDVAERRLLMQRLETAQDKRLRPMTANQSEFAKHRKSVIYEAEMIAALAEVIQREEYEFYDDDDYLAFCKQLKRQARQVVEAAHENNFAVVQQYVGEISKSCSACHEGYK